tara:strand:+ start:2744 stop:3274 length:531 start_codon:yes stop_codon:yes gene_type:complete
MNFKVGDKVSVLDIDCSGYISKIVDNKIYVTTDDGFEIPYSVEELVKMDIEIFNSSLIYTNPVKEFSKNKSIIKKREFKKNKKKSIMVVDLHIDKIINSSKGLKNFDILTIQLETARKRLNFAISKKIKSLIFIHGVGDGVLKLELEYILRSYENLKFFPANFRQYGDGATEVIIL